MNTDTNIERLKKDWIQATQGGKSASWCKFLFYAFIGFQQGWSFLFWFRLAQSKCFFVRIPSMILLKLYSKILNIAISSRTEIGGGLHLGDGMCIVINPKTKIGENCHISQFTNIGTNHDTPAVIGDNVYIGPNVCIVEDVHIGNNVTIGAGSVVTKDVPDDATIAGVPAKVLNFNNPARYIYIPKVENDE